MTTRNLTLGLATIALAALLALGSPPAGLPAAAGATGQPRPVTPQSDDEREPKRSPSADTQDCPFLDAETRDDPELRAELDELCDTLATMKTAPPAKPFPWVLVGVCGVLSIFVAAMYALWIQRRIEPPWPWRMWM